MHSRKAVAHKHNVWSGSPPNPPKTCLVCARMITANNVVVSGCLLSHSAVHYPSLSDPPLFGVPLFDPDEFCAYPSRWFQVLISGRGRRRNIGTFLRALARMCTRYTPTQIHVPHRYFECKDTSYKWHMGLLSENQVFHSGSGSSIVCLEIANVFKLM